MDYIVKNTYYIDSYTMIKGKYYKFSYLEYTSVIGSEFIDEGFYIKEIMNFYLFENGITNTNSFNKYILVNKKYLKKVLLVDDKFIKNYKINDNLFEIDDLKNKVISYGTDESFSNDVTFNGVINSIEKNKDYTLEETTISPFEIQKADEVFITNAIMGLQSVTNYRKKAFETTVGTKLKSSLNFITITG